jgi:hypothetical protein
MVRTVAHDWRLVIYRLGRFHRVVGPGPVVILPGIERVASQFRVRNEPLTVIVDGLFPYGVPVNFTLNLWCCFDLAKAAGNDCNKLAGLVHLTDGERREQVQVKVREAVIRQIANLEARRPIANDASILDRVMALGLGTTRYNELLDAVKEDLNYALPAVGAILDVTQPVTLTKRDISTEIIDAAKRKRSRTIDSEWLTSYVAEIRQQFPDLSPNLLFQILSAIEGVDTGQLHRLLLDQDASTQHDVEYEISGGEEGPNIITKTQRKKAPANSESRAAPEYLRTEPAPLSPERLTKDDLAVLKRVPRRRHDEQLTA